MTKPANIHGTDGGSVTIGLPVYELIGPNGEYGGLFRNALDAADAAKRAWPNHQQDDSCAGLGWDIWVVR